MAKQYIRDTNLKVSKALPAAGATAYTDAIDLGDSAPGLKMEDWELEVAVEATPSLADAKTVTCTLQDSADGVNFTAIASLATVVTTGAGGAGAAAVNRKAPFPKDVRRYVRLKVDVLAAGGDNTAKSATLSAIR